MAWNYDKDKELLAGAATKDAVNACEKYNAYMAYNSFDSGSKADMNHAADFFEMCKENICRELDKKMAELRKRG